MEYTITNPFKAIEIGLLNFSVFNDHVRGPIHNICKEMDSKLFLQLLIISENLPRHNKKKYIETMFLI